MTAVSGRDRKKQICSFWKGRVEISRYVNTNFTFTIFCQFPQQNRSRGENSWFLKNQYSASSKTISIDISMEIQTGRFEEIWDWISAIHCTDYKYWITIENFYSEKSYRLRHWWKKSKSGGPQIRKSRLFNFNGEFGIFWPPGFRWNSFQ